MFRNRRAKRQTRQTSPPRAASILLCLFVLCAVSCERRNEERCTLIVRWDNALTERDSLLFVSYTDTAKVLRVDTLYTSQERGKIKLDLPVYAIGETPLMLYDTHEALFIPLKAEKGREIKVEFDLQVPQLYKATGYDEAKFRTHFITKQKKVLQRLRQAEIEGNDSLAASIRTQLEKQAAHYIDKNATRPGADAVAQEFFPNWRAAKRYLAYTGRDTIAVALSTLHESYALYRSLTQANYLQLPFYALSDTIKALAQAGVPQQKIFLLEMCLSAPTPEREKLFFQELERDSLRRALFVISFPRDTASIMKADSLPPHALSVRHVSANRHSDSLLLQRIILEPFEGEWLRMSQVNMVPEYPYYFVLDRSQRIFCRTASVDSAFHVADSLLRNTPKLKEDSVFLIHD